MSLSKEMHKTSLESCVCSIQIAMTLEVITFPTQTSLHNGYHRLLVDIIDCEVSLLKMMQLKILQV